MKLKEAIGILYELKDAGIDAGHYEAEDAIQLGIEALRQIELIRVTGVLPPGIFLPNETF